LTQDRFWNWLISQSGPVVIGTLFGQAQLGQFYMGSRLAILPTQYLSSIVSTVYFPLLSRSQSDSRAIGQQFIWLLVGIFVAMTALGLFLALNAELVVRVAFGAGWNEAVVVFQVLCLGAGVRASIQICDALNIARADVYALANRRAMAAVAMIVAIYLARNQGLAGAAWAINVGYCLMLVLTVRLANAGLCLGRDDVRPVLVALFTGLLLVGVVDAIAAYGKSLGWVDGMSLFLFVAVANLIVAIPIAVLLSTRFRVLVKRHVGASTPVRGG
jgi:O-antigen/teichoic acid export membrane protein